MPYGTIKVDNITFTNSGSDQTVTVSGLYASTSGNLTVTGTVSGTTANFVSGTFSTQLSGATITGNVGRFTTVTGVSATLTTATITSGIFAAGTATAPSVAIGVGTTYTPGIYAPGTDQVAISTSGTGRLFVTSSGNVGIGIVNPNQLLQVNGNVLIGATPAAQYSNLTVVGDSAIQAASPLFNFVNAAGSTRFGYINHTGTVGDIYILNQEAGAIRLGSNNQERLRITSAGNVGVGSSNPSEQLDLQKANGNGNLGIRLVHVGQVEYKIGINDSDDKLYITNNNGDAAIGSTTKGIAITPAGNVGIGTNSPGALLDISTGATSLGLRLQGTASPYFSVLDSTASVQSLVASDGTGLAGVFGTISNHPTIFRTNNTERLRITSAGNVGIGTVNPGQALDVRGSVRSSIGTGTGAGGAGYALYQFGTSATATENWHIGSEGDGSFRFYNQGIGAGTERLRITSAGDVGIGTSSPGVKLDVAGQIRALDTVDLRLNPIPAGNAGIVGTYSSHDLVFYRNGTERLRIDSSGRLLVGTSSSLGTTSKGLEVANNVAVSTYANNAFGYELTFNKSRGATNGTIVQDGDTIGSIIWRADDGTDTDTPAAQISAVVDGTPGANDMPGRLIFSTTADGASSPTERMRITNSGKTWISSTDSGFGVFQLGNSTSDGEVGIAFLSGVTAFGSTPTSTNGDSRCYVIGNNIYSIGGNSWGIGNKARGTYVAKLTDQNATSWTFSSDIRLKNIQGTIQNGLAKVSLLRPVYFNWKDDELKTRKTGLIAQDVLEVLPEAVDVPPGYNESLENGTSDKPCHLGVAYTDIIPLLVAALQEAKGRIETLEAEVAVLKSA